jgi:signal peptidase
MRATRFLAWLVVLAVGVSVAGHLAGAPVGLAYVTSDSMAPTLSPGDGFVAVPPAVAGPVERGDVVVFRSDGRLTTHRVVGHTDGGFLTRGDANPVTDQAGGDPPVRPAQVVAVAWRPGGTVLALPGVGAAVGAVRGALGAVQTWLAALLGTPAFLGTRGLAYTVFVLTLVWYAVAAVRDRGRGRDRRRSRDRDTGLDARLVVAAMVLVVVAAMTVAMVVPSGPHRFDVVSAATDAPGPDVIARGTTESVPYRVTNSGPVPAVVVFEAGDGVAVEDRELVVPGYGSASTTVRLSAPPETGHYRLYVVERRYLAVLPPPAIRALTAVHPWLPVVVVDAVAGLALYLVGIAVAGTGPLRGRERERGRSLRALIARLWRGG